MTEFQFTIMGKPVAWQRTGMNSAGKGPAIIYTKAKSRAYQSLIREAAQKFWMDGPREVPFALDVALCVKRPKNHFTKKGLKADAPIRCMRKPDLDNIAKQIGDALNGVVWHDDSQVIELCSRRLWAEADSLSVVIQVLS